MPALHRRRAEAFEHGGLARPGPAAGGEPLHPVAFPGYGRLLPGSARQEERPEEARPLQARNQAMDAGRRKEPAQAAPYRQGHQAAAGRRMRRGCQRGDGRALRCQAEEAARLLFQAMSDCCEKRSPVIAANIEFSKWGVVFGGGRQVRVRAHRAHNAPWQVGRVQRHEQEDGARVDARKGRDLGAACR